LDKFGSIKTSDIDRTAKLGLSKKIKVQYEKDVPCPDQLLITDTGGLLGVH
jgi:hypothetical protein